MAATCPALVTTCQQVLAGLPAYAVIAPQLHGLADYYCALQVYKHVREEERVPLLQAWFGAHERSVPPMAWYEFAACSGSTLGIFCLVAHASHRQCTAELARAIHDAYFPWVQGLHILLDYFIDQDEDRRAGDLNFCSYYSDQQEMVTRLSHFYRQADLGVSALPNAGFHRLVIKGLLAVYCADAKVHRHRELRAAASRFISLGGAEGRLIYLLSWLYRRMSPGDGGSRPEQG